MRSRLAYTAIVCLVLAACGAGDDGGTGGGGQGGAAGGQGGSAGAAAGGAAGGAAGRGGVTGGGAGAGGVAGGGAGTTGGGGSGGGASGTGGGAAGTGGRGGGGGTAGGQGGSAGAGGGAAGRGGAAGAGSGGSGGAGGATVTNPRVMLLGDSTTGSSCYRALLWSMLRQSGRTQFDFIGTRNGDPGCNVSGYDRDNEGHGGYIVTDILKASGTGVRPGGADSGDPYVSDARDLATWFDNKPADIVLMHFGTNDVWNNIAPATILNAYTTILGRLRGANPNVRVLVAQITSLMPSGCSTCPSRVTTLNGMIPGWATANATAASPIMVVDQNTGFAPATDTSDGVHSNASGAMKVAAKWFTALSPLIP